MTKLKLELAQAAGEILTREEQKRILGGASGSGGDDYCTGKKAWAKCIDSNDKQIGDGCYTSSDPSSCPSGQRVTCCC